jgi:hypothetical protein
VTEEEIALKPQTAAFLVAPLVDHLWQQWSDGEGCCNQCCCACIALNDLLDEGKLDELYGIYVKICGSPAEGHATWDAEKGQVERTWLTAAWAFPKKCHELVKMLDGSDEA